MCEYLANLWKILDVENRRGRSQIIDNDIRLLFYLFFIFCGEVSLLFNNYQGVKLDIYCTYKDTVNAGLGRTLPKSAANLLYH